MSIDAMGCQYEIADKIVKKKADYLFSLKGNQGNLYEDVFEGFDFGKPASCMKDISYQTIYTHDEKHGRIEDREYAVSDDVQWLHLRHPKWKSIKSIGLVDSTREVKGKETCERRYYVSSLTGNPEEFAGHTRALGDREYAALCT